MSSIIFLEKEGQLVPSLVLMGNRVDARFTPSWQVNSEELSAFTQDQLKELLPPDVRAPARKSDLVVEVMEHWEEYVAFKNDQHQRLMTALTDAGFSSGGDGGGYGRRGDGGCGDGGGEDQQAPLPDDGGSDEDEGDFSIRVLLPNGAMISQLVASTDTIYTVKSMLQNKVNIHRRSIRLMNHTIELEDVKTIQDYNIDEDTVLHLLPTISGGGKRALSSTTSKMTREQKISELNTEYQTTMLVAQSKNLNLLINVRNTLTNAMNQITTSPEEALDTALNGIDISALKRIQTSCASGNLDHKLSVVAKGIFGTETQLFEEHRQQFQMLEGAMKNIVFIMLLHNFGVDDNVSISWQNFIGEITEIITEKTRVQAETRARTPAPATGDVPMR